MDANTRVHTILLGARLVFQKYLQIFIHRSLALFPGLSTYPRAFLGTIEPNPPSPTKRVARYRCQILDNVYLDLGPFHIR
jgi:hypothetical protein